MDINNINKNQLSRVLSVGASAVGKWINGEIKDLRLPSLTRISSYFDIPIDKLVFCNLSAQSKLNSLINKYVYIRSFCWTDKINLESKTKFLRIPEILVNGDFNNLFSVEFSHEYNGIFPNDSILLFEQDLQLAVDDIVLLRNKFLDNLLFAVYKGSMYKSILTNELMDIEQYNVEGVLSNIILHKVFYNL